MLHLAESILPKSTQFCQRNHKTRIPFFWSLGTVPPYKYFQKFVAQKSVRSRRLVPSYLIIFIELKDEKANNFILGNMALKVPHKCNIQQISKSGHTILPGNTLKRFLQPRFSGDHIFDFN